METAPRRRRRPKLIGNGTLKVGYVLPETGQLAFLGPAQIQALEFAIEQINANGGVLGKQIPDPVAADEAGDQAVVPGINAYPWRQQHAQDPACCFTGPVVQNNDLLGIVGVVMSSSSQFHGRPT